MPYVPSKRDALLCPMNGVNHLFVVLNDPDEQGNCLLVMISSTKAGRNCDPACPLNKGDHPFIQHDSHVVYRLASTSRAAHITKMVGMKFFLEKDAVSEQLYEKICSGLFESDETTPAMMRYARGVGVQPKKQP